MSHSDGADPTAILAALADPSRRGLYEAVRRSALPLGRDELAEQAGVAPGDGGVPPGPARRGGRAHVAVPPSLRSDRAGGGSACEALLAGGG